MSNRKGEKVAQRSRLVAMCSALFYCVTSISIIACNKIVLTSYKFPSSSALACCQFVISCIALIVFVVLGILEPMASPRYETLRCAGPLTLLYLADVTMGLSATGSLSLPMFTCLRRASIPMTMLLEGCLGQNRPKTIVVFSVWGMVGGAVIAAYDDLAYDAKAYSTVFMNDALTAGRGVYLKSILGGNKLDKVSLLFYNAALSFMVLGPYIFFSGALHSSLQWYYNADQSQRLALFISSSLGPILQYAIFLCTQHNSALTTTVVGALKNIFTAYFGMLLGGDYMYSLFNFFGISISCAASLLYSYAAILNRGSLSADLRGASTNGSTTASSSSTSSSSSSSSKKTHPSSSDSASAAALLLGTSSQKTASTMHTTTNDHHSISILTSGVEDRHLIVDNLSPSSEKTSLLSSSSANPNNRRRRAGED